MGSLEIILEDRFNDQMREIYSKAVGYIVGEIERFYDIMENPNKNQSIQKRSSSNNLNLSAKLK